MLSFWEAGPNKETLVIFSNLDTKFWEGNIKSKFNKPPWFKLLGSALDITTYSIVPIDIPKGILLLVELIISDILTFINISINKNKIETAPT